MTRKFIDKIALDDEVAEFVKRIGALQSPLNHITDYVVSRDVNNRNVTKVTISFIADDEFSKEDESADTVKEISNG